MYETSFRLQRRPFAATPDARCYFESESRMVAVRDLVAAIEGERGVGILIGAAGLGKTATLIHLAEQLREKFTVLRISAHGVAAPRALLQALLYELGERYTGLDEQECRLELRSCLKRLVRSQKPALLLVDEGEHLTGPLFAELRGYVEEVESGRSLLRLVVAGQPALEDHLLAPEAASFYQRVASQQYLPPLSQAESAAYVAYRLAWAGAGEQELFSDEAKQLVVQTSDGVPRCLNQLCDHALLLAFVVESPQVARKQVEEALSDLKQLPLHWNTTSSTTNTATEPATIETNDEAASAPAPLTNAASFEVGAEPPVRTLTQFEAPAAITTSNMVEIVDLSAENASLTGSTSIVAEETGVTVTTNVTPTDLLPACEVDEVIAARLEQFSTERSMGEMRISASGQLPASEEWSLPTPFGGMDSVTGIDDAMESVVQPVPVVDVASRSPWIPPEERPTPEFHAEVIADHWSNGGSASPESNMAGDVIEPLDCVEPAATYTEPISAEAWSQTMESDGPSILSMSQPAPRTEPSETTFEPRNVDRRFDAEAVFDRYAALDAGRTDLPPVTVPAVRRGREEPRTVTERPRLFANRPDLAAGAILNLVSSLDGDGQPGTGAAVDARRGSGARAEAAMLETNAGSSEDWDEDLERTVLQTSEQMLVDVRSRLPDWPTSGTDGQAANAPHVDDQLPEDTDYDVIEPTACGLADEAGVSQPAYREHSSWEDADTLELTPPQATMSPVSVSPVSRERMAREEIPSANVTGQDDLEPTSETADDEPATVFSPYKRLFSMLRRKQRRSA